ncbi:Sin-like protein conserved region-domain-containing protein [Pseudomassariella vexata]|uniref:Sin-like protein conserved region-domain-containing protein n=1 Tax=Pseudomassariella vexata TaxID=1141098 RepID=A0A1Y2E1S8_9PEZI|nr:Sin-like protein conserved region-domain-containing protein [Pseudomassariella vexata]ORY65276.1 Sin-like protein conserved region-domain-containing protein [Pseudomassariella vexata]
MEVDNPSPKPEEARPVASSNSSDDPDPIIASYNVFTNPSLPSTRKIFILQHPNKQGAAATSYPSIQEVRIKPSSGMIEVDVPLPYQDAGFDRDKGMKWGGALQKSMGSKNGGSHGLAGGFGVGVPPARNGRRGEGDREIYDWSEAVRQDKVLRTQTLGGMVGSGEDCRWMVGVFKGGNLHLTPATSEIQLRPQMHHLDAQIEQERLNRPRDGGLGQGPLDGKTGPTPAAAKAITMTVKSALTGGEVVTETMTDRLRHVQMEAWQRLKYIGEEEDEAWTLHDNTLLFQGGAKPGDANGKSKILKAEDADLEKEAVKLTTRWGEEDFLRAVAGKNRDGVLEGYGSTAAAVKDEDIEFIKSEEHLEGGISAVTGKKAAPAAAKGKGKATAAASTAKKPTGTKGK